MILSVGLIILGPAIWVNILGHEKPVFPYAYPAVFSMPAAFIMMWIVSVLDNSRTAESDRNKHDEMLIKIYTGTAT